MKQNRGNELTRFLCLHRTFHPSPGLNSPSDVKGALEFWHHTSESDLALSLPWILFWIVTEPEACNVDNFEVSMLVDKLNIDSINGQYSINRMKLHDSEKINAKRALYIYSRLNDPQLSMLRNLVLALKQHVGDYKQDEVDEVLFILDLLIEERTANQSE